MNTMTEAKEIYIASSTKTAKLIDKISEIIESGQIAVVSGINSAVPKTIDLVEPLKIRHPGLSQVNMFDTVEEVKVKFCVKLAKEEIPESAHFIAVPPTVEKRVRYWPPEK
jgi:hypothetical protein